MLNANHEMMEQIRVVLNLQLIRIVFHCRTVFKIYILQLISLESNVVTFDKTNKKLRQWQIFVPHVTQQSDAGQLMK